MHAEIDLAEGDYPSPTLLVDGVDATGHAGAARLAPAGSISHSHQIRHALARHQTRHEA